MASKAEVNTVYAAGLVQGIALVTFGPLFDSWGRKQMIAGTYLVSGETWPIEIRAEAIAIFLAIGCIAGALGPAFYGALIGNGSSRTGLFWGYLIGAGIMVIGGLVEIFLGVNAAGKSLEQVTKPLTSVSKGQVSAAA